jgi:hypothetical protein
VLCIVTAVSASEITRQDVLLAVDALVAALMAPAPSAELLPLVDQLELVTGQNSVIPTAVATELRLAINLVRDGQPCPAVSALLAARSRLWN